MSAEYKIKTFSNLTEQEVSTLYDFCSSHQTEDFYSDLNEMKKYYSSNVLNKGENHFSLWVNDDIKACGGYVVFLLAYRFLLRMIQKLRLHLIVQYKLLNVTQKLFYPQ